MKWFISLLVIILSLELGAQSIAISVIENPVIPNLEEVQGKMNLRKAVVDYQFVAIDLKSLPNETSIRVAFFDVKTVINRNNLVKRSTFSYTWYGRSEGNELNARFTVNGKNISGLITTANMHYLVESFGNIIIVSKLDASKLPPEGCYLNNDSDERIKSSYSATGTPNHYNVQREMNIEAADDLELPDNQCKLRVLVMYTELAASNYGGNMGNLAQTGVDNINWAFANSYINRKVELVFVEQVSYIESIDMHNDLDSFRTNNDGVMDIVHSRRIEYAADVCVLLLDNSNEPINNRLCGTSAALRSSSINSFVAVDWSCLLTKFSFTHEIGHLFGCQHAPGDVILPSLSAYAPDAHGYKDPSNNWRTVMSGDCNPGGCARKLHFSNPNAYYSGYVTGNTVSNNAKMIEDNFERMMFLSPNSQNLVVTSTDVNGTWAKTIYAGGTITTSGTVDVQWGRNFRFRAEEFVELLPGFEVQTGAQFEAIVLPCGELGSGPLDFNPLADILDEDLFAYELILDSEYESVQIVPNPGKATFKVINMPNERSAYKIIIYSANGQLIRRFKAEAIGDNYFSLDGLQNGSYYVKIISEEQILKVLKLIKN